MKKLLLLSLFVVSAFAAEVRFTIEERTSWGDWVFYNCDSVENFVEDMLVDMNAEDINVRCTGGLDPFFPQFSTAARVRASFTPVSPDQPEEVELRGFDNCHLAHSSFKGIKDEFNIENLEMRRSCRRPGDRYRIRFDLL